MRWHWGLSVQCLRLTIHFRLMRSLRMCGVINPLPHTPSQLVFRYSDNFTIFNPMYPFESNLLHSLQRHVLWYKKSQKHFSIPPPPPHWWKRIVHWWTFSFPSSAPSDSYFTIFVSISEFIIISPSFRLFISCQLADPCITSSWHTPMPNLTISAALQWKSKKFKIFLQTAYSQTFP